MVPYSSGTCSCRKKVGRRDKGSRTRKLKESRMHGTHGRINEQRMIRREADRTAREQSKGQRRNVSSLRNDP